MSTDIKLTDDTIELEGNTKVKGHLEVGSLYSFGTLYASSMIYLNDKSHNTSSGPLAGLRVALLHAEGDILKINSNSNYPGGVSIDSIVNIGPVQIKPDPLVPDQHGTPPTQLHSLTIGPDTIWFNTKPLIPINAPTTNIDLRPLIEKLNKVETDGEFTVGTVKITSSLLVPDQQGTPTTHLHSLTIGPDTIWFNTKPLFPHTAPTIHVDLMDVIINLQKEIESLKKRITQLEGGN